MADERETAPLRDSSASPFARILSELESACVGFETAVFFDDLGETIDYHSYLDPFSARLVAAHHGVLFSSATHRLEWLGAGATTHLEIYAANRDSVTLRIAEGYYMTVVVRAGALSEALFTRIAEVAVEFCSEAGL
jgi:predicted regulator of Ras-like GTPase activity (Roadblock/LC7/MglB family)